jgi:NhaP-type Na+/H+ or K+/H+ antiporter
MLGRYVFASVIFFVLDLLYLNYNERLFKNQIISVQRVILQPNYPAIFITYILLAFILCYFIIRPHIEIEEAFLLGFLVNGIFEFTNMSIFKKWELKTAIMDTVWGGSVFALATQATYMYFSK